MADCKNELYVYDLNGKMERKINVPIGQVASMNTKYEESEIFLKFTSFLSPGLIYRTDTKQDILEVWKETKVEGVNFDDYESKQVFIESKDGVKVPMFITHKKGLKLD